MTTDLDTGSLGVPGIDYCEMALTAAREDRPLDDAHVEQCPVCFRRRRVREAEFFGWDPLPAADAIALMEPMTRRYRGDQIDIDPVLVRGFYAAMAADDELEATFASFVAAARDDVPSTRSFTDRVMAAVHEARADETERAPIAAGQRNTVDQVRDVIALRWARGKERFVHTFAVLQNGATITRGLAPGAAIAMSSEPGNAAGRTDVSFTLPSSAAPLARVTFRQQPQQHRVAVHVENVGPTRLVITISAGVPAAEQRIVLDANASADRLLDGSVTTGEITVETFGESAAGEA